MTEVAFARSFLAALDGRPIRISPDHVEDPKSSARSAYILPKMPKAMSKRKGTSVAPGQERSLVVTVKSLRNPPLDLRLSSQSLNTSVHDIKVYVAKETSISEDKIKILHKKKPVSDSKVLKDLVGEDDTTVDFSVMVMGGAAAVAVATQPVEPIEVAQDLHGNNILQTQEFWDDLKGFLRQRIQDEQLVAEITNTFRESWTAKG
ncbi:cell-cycle control medial ring component-domain-containing protein [Xylaria nigripes]|nr:cell-cycle control medial ring component-domain-containing protein [Xylaria nigripes]